MDIALSLIALASFLAMILAWAVVPHSGLDRQVAATATAPEAGAAAAFGVN
jgi:uncharacterized membrane protein